MDQAKQLVVEHGKCVSLRVRKWFNNKFVLARFKDFSTVLFRNGRQIRKLTPPRLDGDFSRKKVAYGVFIEWTGSDSVDEVFRTYNLTSAIYYAFEYTGILNKFYMEAPMVEPQTKNASVVVYEYSVKCGEIIGIFKKYPCL